MDTNELRGLIRELSYAMNAITPVDTTETNLSVRHVRKAREALPVSGPADMAVYDAAELAEMYAQRALDAIAEAEAKLDEARAAAADALELIDLQGR